MGAPQAAIGRQRAPNLLVSQHLNVIKIPCGGATGRHRAPTGTKPSGQPASKCHQTIIEILMCTAVLYIKPINDTHSRHHDFDSHVGFIDKTMKLQCYMIHSSLLLIPKPLIFPKQNVQMSSQQPSGDSNTLIDDSKTIDISIAKRANVLTAAFWRFQNINNGFTAASC